MHRVKCIKIICSVNVISIIITVLFFNNQSSKPDSFPPLVLNLTASHSPSISFRDKRTNQLLTSYSHVYEDSVYKCNTTRALRTDQRIAFDIISIKLATLRLKITPYPEEYFHGRGIVLTTGLRQLKFARVNLKMLEVSGTQLPIQVICLVCLKMRTQKILIVDLVFIISNFT